MSDEKAEMNNRMTKAGIIMISGESTKQQISALADGELPEAEAEDIIAVLRQSGKADWDVYHQIGDVLRNEAMAQPLSAGFSAQLAMRLAAEPPLLAPGIRRGKRDHTRWSLAVAAIAATLVGFVIAPHLLHDTAVDQAGSTTAAGAISHAAVIAQSDLAISDRREAVLNEYLRIHQSSHPSIYGATQLARPVDLNRATDH